MSNRFECNMIESVETGNNVSGNIVSGFGSLPIKIYIPFWFKSSVLKFQKILMFNNDTFESIKNVISLYKYMNPDVTGSIPDERNRIFRIFFFFIPIISLIPEFQKYSRDIFFFISENESILKISVWKKNSLFFTDGANGGNFSPAPTEENSIFPADDRFRNFGFGNFRETSMLNAYTTSKKKLQDGWGEG